MLQQLIKPFTYYSGKQLFIVGLAAMLVGSWLAWHTAIRFEGVMDAHFGEHHSWWHPFLENGVNVLCTGVPLLILGLSINARTRPIDILNTVLIARIPYYLLPFMNINGYMQQNVTKLVEGTNENTSPSLTVIIVNIFYIICIVSALVIFILWIFEGFKTATNSKKNWHKIALGACILFAEIISKVIFSILKF